MSKRTSTEVAEVVDALRRRIFDQELLSGARLREAALAEEFGIPRPRLRDAFAVLEQRGLIERNHNQGAVVARLDAAEAKAIFEVREVLEALAVRLATQNTGPETWQDLRRTFGTPAREAIKRGDIGFYAENIHAFQSLVLEKAGNETLSRSLEKLYDRTHLLIHRLLRLPGRAEVGVVETCQILGAMIAGRAEEAEELKRANMRSARLWYSEHQNLFH